MWIKTFFKVHQVNSKMRKDLFSPTNRFAFLNFSPFPHRTSLSKHHFDNNQWELQFFCRLLKIIISKFQKHKIAFWGFSINYLCIKTFFKVHQVNSKMRKDLFSPTHRFAFLNFSPFSNRTSLQKHHSDNNQWKLQFFCRL